MIALRTVKKNCDNMLSRFHLILERNGRTDGHTDRRTDRFAISISRVSMLTRDKNAKFAPSPRKYKTAKDIQTPPKIYNYVAELSCAKSEQNRLTQFSWGNRGSSSFFTHTHTISQTNSIISSTDHKYGRIWNIYSSKRAVSRLSVPFGGIVDDKSCLGFQISSKPNFWGSEWEFQAWTTKKFKSV